MKLGSWGVEIFYVEVFAFHFIPYPRGEACVHVSASEAAKLQAPETFRCAMPLGQQTSSETFYV